MTHPLFFRIDDLSQGLARTLAPGITTRVFDGDQAMVSVVRFAPDTMGQMHHHPEEQWGLCLEGSGIRYQDTAEIPIRPGDFWRTPGDVPHTMASGPEGLVVLDVFAPPRKAYASPGEGFGTGEE